LVEAGHTAGFNSSVIRVFLANGGLSRRGKSWSRLSEQIFRVDKWNLCHG
jgi:hypothetical protein